MVAKLNKITSWQAALIIAILGFAVFFTGLATPFQGDDIPLIVNNVPVHSITHVKLFFEGGTFYNGQGLSPLTGAYYRPLMMTIFSLLYTLFGPHALYFHLFQLVLCIASTIILFHVFKYSFKPGLALFLSLVFLVHPINSQVVFAIPNLQDSLFFFFGVLAIYLLLRFKSIKSLMLVTASMFLCLLSKESAVVFIAMALVYLYWFDSRKRLYTFAGMMVLPTVAWLILKTQAVSLIGHSYIAPIDKLSLGGRLLTAPSIMLFYITKFIFPWKLASGYYWVYPAFSIRHVLLPLIVDLAVIALAVYMGVLIRNRASKSQYFTYLFFATWCALGFLLLLQIIPLDFTAAEFWFYFPMAGVLGMIGVVLTVFPPRIRPIWLLMVGIAVIGILGFRTGLRGLDYRNQYTLAYKSIAASPDDYVADNIVAAGLNDQGKFAQGKVYAQRSVDIFPTFVNYNNLGLSLAGLGDYSAAAHAYYTGLSYGKYVLIYENIAALTLVYGNPNTDKQYLVQTLGKYPQDSIVWLDLAILEDRYNDNADAKVAITNAAMYGQAPKFIYNSIMNNQPFTVELIGTGKSVNIP
jgi:tetratricopeptide (TPR) repeat protein